MEKVTTKSSMSDHVKIEAISMEMVRDIEKAYLFFDMASLFMVPELNQITI
jgi:hypothetical protein